MASIRLLPLSEAPAESDLAIPISLSLRIHATLCSPVRNRLQCNDEPPAVMVTRCQDMNAMRLTLDRRRLRVMPVHCHRAHAITKSTHGPVRSMLLA